MILDMRYNSGGRVYIARYLASLIAGDIATDKIFTSILYNDRYSHWNEDYYFKKESNRLNISKVYILVTNQSCSASELVINGLDPHIDVTVIGERTCGKPVGMSGFQFCDKYLMPIQFGLVNSEGEGGYFDGLKPVCLVSDDIKHDFGDTNEAMLKEAIYFLKNRKCSMPKQSGKRYKKKPAPEVLSGWNKEVGAI